MSLEEKLPALHRALAAAHVPHAFGGAIALAYWTVEPRGTRDIDINVFLPASEAQRVLDALPDGVTVTPELAARLQRDEQVRLMWDETPVDLFFDYAEVHAAAARHAGTGVFAGTEIPIVGADELGVFKAMFNRPRDWGDIAEMIAADTLDVAVVRRALESMLGPDDERLVRLDELEARSR